MKEEKKTTSLLLMLTVEPDDKQEKKIGSATPIVILITWLPIAPAIAPS